MSEAARPWRVTGYLDVLRPEPGWTVDLAIIAAYSADPISVVASLLALIGRDDEERPAARRDLADAIEAVRGRFRVVIQRGRLAKMARTPQLTGVLDQFIRDVPFDERRQSWHPKAALVKLSSGKAVEWRLWVGSRNLTAPENRDLGLFLVSRSGSPGRRVLGAGDIAATLAERADLPAVSPRRLAAEIEGLKWKAPADVRVDGLRISTGKSEWSLPVLPKSADAVTVVSPFLDAGFLRHVAKTECLGGQRQLLSTRFEIERLAATSKDFGDVLALDAPDYPPTNLDDPVSAAAGPPVETAGEGEEMGRGLHAKLLHVRQGGRRRLWMGSANATQRAWTGRNVEIIAELTVGGDTEAGLLRLLAEARPVRWPEGVQLTDTQPLKDALEEARSEVSARWSGQIFWDDGGVVLRHAAGLHPSNPRIGLQAGLITGGLERWAPGETELDLGPVDRADQTELVQLRLTLDDAVCDWIMQAPATPPFGVDRDRAAFMRSMGAREFLLWIADTMRGAAAAPDEPDWTQDAPPGREPTGAVPTWMSDLPTQEEIFKVWARSPDLYKAVQHRIQAFLPALLEQTLATDPQGHKQLQAFAKMWATCEAGLGAPS